MPRVLRNPHPTPIQRWVPQPMASSPATPEVDARNEAEAALAQAKRDADDMRAAARDEAEALRRQARDEGYARGLEEAEGANRETATALAALVEEVNREREDFFQRAEADLARLSITIAEKILAQQIALKPEGVVELTRKCMKRIREREVLQIRANPEDIPRLNQARGALLAEVDGVREIALYDDRRVERGGIIIESAGGTLDARISSQLDIVTRALTDAMEGTHGAETD